MENNFFIAYDLMREGQNYRAVSDEIESLGHWARAQMSLYYVSTDLTMEQVVTRVRRVMDSNDKLIVIKADRAQWFNLHPEASKQISDCWNR